LDWQVPEIEQMTRYIQILLVVVFIILAIGLTYSWFDRPRRTTERFVGNLYFQRYEDAARMLRPPSALRVDSDGGLALIDKKGRLTSVPKAKLPFKVGGHDGGPEHDFKMTALGPSTGGVLHTPAVTLYLKIVGGDISIESVGD
jgi:hypothetical protein